MNRKEMRRITREKKNGVDDLRGEIWMLRAQMWQMEKRLSELEHIPIAEVVESRQ